MNLDLNELRRRLLTQDGRCTRDPLFEVRIPSYEYHTNEDYGGEKEFVIDGKTIDIDSLKELFLEHFEEFEWDEEEEEYEPFDMEAALNSFHIVEDDFDDWCDDSYVEVYYKVRRGDKTIGTFLTEVDADEFIARQKHNYPEAFTFVVAAHHELADIRKFFMLSKEEQLAIVLNQ